MSDEQKEKLGFYYKLNKLQIFEELTKRGVDFDENEKFDVLRSKLVEIVKQEIANASKEKVEDKSEDAEVQNKNEPNVTNDESSSEYESVSEPQEDNKMANDGIKLQFCLERDDWELFLERLEILMAARELKEDKKANALVERLDDDAFQLLRNLSAPKPLKEQKFTDMVDLMNNHLNPKPSEVMERCTFNQARQRPDEKCADFAARLKKPLLNCNYNDLKTALRDQFVCGIRDEETRVALFKMEKLDYEMASKEAVARESAVKNATTSINTLKGRNTQKEVFAMNNGKKKFDAKLQGHHSKQDRAAARRKKRTRKSKVNKTLSVTAVAKQITCAQSANFEMPRVATVTERDTWKEYAKRRKQL